MWTNGKRKGRNQQMTTHWAPPAEAAALENESVSGAPTFGWFVRRSALWLGVVATGVILACLIYAAASSVDHHEGVTKTEASLTKL